MSSSSVNQLNAGTANTDNEAQCFDIIPKEEVESTECIGFDLDLTLVDSSAGILETFKHILTKHGYITKVTTGYNDAAALRKENDDAYIISNLSELKDVMIKITSDRLASTCIVS